MSTTIPTTTQRVRRDDLVYAFEEAHRRLNEARDDFDVPARTIRQLEAECIAAERELDAFEFGDPDHEEDIFQAIRAAERASTIFVGGLYA